MNRNLLFLFFFLAVINAMPHQFNKRTTDFKKCPSIPGNPVKVTPLTVTVVPDPIVSNKNATYTISGTAKVDIPTDVKHAIVYNKIGGFGPVIGLPFFADFCKGSNPCPVKKGDTFNRTYTAEAPTLPTVYAVTITVNTPEVVYACALATVGL